MRKVSSFTDTLVIVRGTTTAFKALATVRHVLVLQFYFHKRYDDFSGKLFDMRITGLPAGFPAC